MLYIFQFVMVRQVVILLLATLVCSSYVQVDGVLVLNESNFAAAVKEHSFLFVKFYTPWCGHCKKLSPIFIQLAADLAKSHPNIRLAEIDLDEAKAIQAQLRIQSFPTLILFKDGLPNNFGGSRTKDFMLQWLSKKVQEPIILVDESRLAALQSDGNVNIVFFGDLKTPQGTTLLNLAKNDDYNMYYRVESSSRPKGSVEIYRSFGETVSNNVVDYNTKSWIALYDRPFVYDYDDRTTKELFTEKRNGIILFVPTSEASLSIITAFRDASEDLKIKQKKRLIFTQIEASTEAYAGLSEYIKINPALNPIIYVKNAEKLKYVYSGKPNEITSSKILDFIKLVESGKIRKYKMDEETRPKAAQTSEL